MISTTIVKPAEEQLFPRARKITLSMPDRSGMREIPTTLLNESPEFKKLNEILTHPYLTKEAVKTLEALSHTTFDQAQVLLEEKNPAQLAQLALIARQLNIHQPVLVATLAQKTYKDPFPEKLHLDTMFALAPSFEKPEDNPVREKLAEMLLGMAHWTCIETLKEGKQFVTFNIGTTTLATVSPTDEKILVLYDYEKKTISKMPHTSKITALYYSPDGPLMVGMSNGDSACYWLPRDAKPTDIVKGNGSLITAIAKQREGGSKSAIASSDGSITLKNSFEKTAEILKDGHKESVNCLIFDNKARSLISGSNDGTIKVWNLLGYATLSETYSGHTEPVTCVALNPEGNMLASGSLDGDVKLWRHVPSFFKTFSNNACLKTLKIDSPILSLTFTPTRDWLVTGSEDGTVKVWDYIIGICLNTLREHTDPVTCVAFGRDGKILASASEDSVKLWQNDAAQEISERSGKDLHEIPLGTLAVLCQKQR